jgi:FMN phosphatase YigB (HAD superfamily)
MDADLIGSQDVDFLLDVDNTLLDNDRFTLDLRERITSDFGEAENARYWSIYETLRDETGYADYLEALQKFRGVHDADPKLLKLSEFLLEYPFADRFYPDALNVVAHLATLGSPVVLSDGDIVFQPRKIQRSGLWDAVDGRVMIAVHKQACLEAMRQRFPATHYVMIDDKPNLLAAMKKAMGVDLTTVFVRQGHYAIDSDRSTIDPPPDRTVDAIAELRGLDLSSIQSIISASA